jgi:Fe2+ or Zn2+ uptake regulation protein
VSDEPALSAESLTLLQKSGLRLTRPRRWLAMLLDHPTHHHVTVLQAQAILRQQGANFPQASIYNGLNEFVRCSLARRFDLGDHSVYCLRQKHHHHFLMNGRLHDIADPQPVLQALPAAPFGTVIDRVDILIHVRDEGS